MLYPRLTYGADKRYLRRKSLIKIYRREIRGERVSKGDVNEPALPPSLPFFYSSRDVRGSERGRGEREVITEGAKIVDAGDRSFVNFIDLCRVEFLFFLERLSRKERFIVYLFILFLISEKFITSGLLLLFIVIRLKRNTWIVLIFNRQFVKKKSRKRKTYFGLNVLFAQRKWDLDS